MSDETTDLKRSTRHPTEHHQDVDVNQDEDEYAPTDTDMNGNDTNIDVDIDSSNHQLLIHWFSHRHFQNVMKEFRKFEERWRNQKKPITANATTTTTDINNSDHSIINHILKIFSTGTTAITNTTNTTNTTAAATMIFILTWYYYYYSEMRLQRQLTAPPIVYGQILVRDNDITNNNNNNNTKQTTGNGNSSHNNSHAMTHPHHLQQHHVFQPFSYITIADIYQHMIHSNQFRNILQRPIQPSLFVGTRAYVSSTMAYLIQQHSPSLYPKRIRNLLVPPNTSTDSTAAHPNKRRSQHHQHFQHYDEYEYDPHHQTVQFREVMKMPTDGATIAIDWKFPYSSINNSNSNNNNTEATVTTTTKDNTNDHWSIDEWIHHILHGPISRPVVLILHGINNHTNFGYIQSMMNICCSHGCIAAGMNFRGCATTMRSSSYSTTMQQPNTTTIHHQNNNNNTATTPPLFDSTTPRTYNGAYTGDLRSVVQKLSIRLLIPQPEQSSVSSLSHDSSSIDSQEEERSNKEKLYQPLFLVGNSLGANLLTKYLGEEGRCCTLHPCIAGGVTMGNPMHIDSRNASPLISPLIALGAKRGLYNIYPTMKAMVRSSSYFRQCMRNGWKAMTLADYDNAMAPIFCRNEPSYPFQYQIGYHNNHTEKDAANDYWTDASSYRQLPHISVPFLQLIARDDFLTFRSFRDHMYYNIINPYVMVVETTCGGHLGWHEAVVDTNSSNNDTTGDKKNRLSWTHSLLGTSWADVAMIDFIQAILELHKERQIGVHSNKQRTGGNYFNCDGGDRTRTSSFVNGGDDATRENEVVQRSRL